MLRLAIRINRHNLRFIYGLGTFENRRCRRDLAAWWRSVILDRTNGGDTVSTEAVAARRHAGPHLPAIGWNNTTGNSQLALAA